MIGAILLALLIVLVVAFSGMKAILQTAVVQYGSEVLHTPVQLKETKISMVTGRAKLSGLSICNPERYSSPYMATVERVWMKMDRGSILSDRIRIEQVELINPTLTYERKGDISNLDEFLQTLNSEAEKEEVGGTSAEEKRSVRISIERLLVKGAELAVILPGGAIVRVPLPDFELRNVGGEEGEVPALITEKIFLEFTKEASAPEVEKMVRKAIDDMGIKLPEKWKKDISDQIQQNFPAAS